MTAKPAKSAAPPQQDDLQGHAVDASDPEALRNAIDLAFNFRGDVTISLRRGDPIEGYVFDRRLHGAPDRQQIRIIPKGSDERLEIPLADIAGLRFTGKDTASGKSFESWIKKYAQKKLAGESASIESESLDD
jgi:hypothetical protein